MKMKKRYTKRQILESIKYWKKQLKLGNYKKLNESNGLHPLLGACFTGPEDFNSDKKIIFNPDHLGEITYYDNIENNDPDIEHFDEWIRDGIREDIDNSEPDALIRTEVSTSYCSPLDDEKRGKGSLWIPVSQVTDSIIDKLANDEVRLIKNNKSAVVSFEDWGSKAKIYYYNDKEYEFLLKHAPFSPVGGF